MELDVCTGVGLFCLLVVCYVNGGSEIGWSARTIEDEANVTNSLGEVSFKESVLWNFLFQEWCINVLQW